MELMNNTTGCPNAKTEKKSN